ncbi:hypothetical protein [Ruminococcus sp.]|uniref:hypothetical protein n=1 Tax=Ruminococcus sp. TaxID=41978 RepID=UPI003EFD6CA4
MEEFVFKKSWLIEATKKLPKHCIAELIILVVEYGLTKKHEKVTNDCIIPLLEEIKAEIDSQQAKPPKKEKVKIPPSLEEVIQYVKDNNLNVDPYQFWNFYESKGWFVGKNKMKNWHSAIATWVKRNQVQYGTGQQSNIIDKVADILAD